MSNVAFVGSTLLVDELAVAGAATDTAVVIVSVEGDGFADGFTASTAYSAPLYSAESSGGSTQASESDSLSLPDSAPASFLFVLPEATADQGGPAAPLIISALDFDAGDAYAEPQASAEPPPAGEASSDGRSSAQAPASADAMAPDMNIGAGLVIGDDSFYWKPIEDDGQVIAPGDVDGDGLETGGGDAGSDDTSYAGDGGTVYDYSGYGYSGYGTSAGDVNGDGFDDSIVTTYAYADGVYTSSTFVVFGTADGAPPVVDPSAIDGSNGFVIAGASADGYGPSLAAAGDINGDGFADLIVNTYGWNGSESAYVVFGNADGAASVDVANLDGANGFKIDGPDVGDYGSWWISAVGDVNGDGFDDIVIDAFDWNSDDTYSQASYVLLGTGDGFAAAVDATTLASAGEYFAEPGVEPEPAPVDDGDIVIGIGIISDPGSGDDIGIEPVVCDIMPVCIAWNDSTVFL